MFIWKSGLLVAGCALTASAAMVAAAGSWVTAGFGGRSLDTATTALWVQAAPQLAKASIGTKTGDENFWLSALEQPAQSLNGLALNGLALNGLALGGLVASAETGAAHRVAPGDRISISGKANGAQDLEVVDVRPIDTGVLPVAAGTVPAPRLILVTCKTVGDTEKSSGRIVRFILEDTASNTQPATGANHKAL